MGAVRIARKAAGQLRPLTRVQSEVARAAERTRRVGVVPGAGAAGVAALLGVEPGAAPDADGLLVHVAVPGEPQAAAVRGLAAQKEQGGRALALLVGSPAERAALEREILSVPPLELGDLRRVDDMRELTLAAPLIDALGGDAVAVGRGAPAFRDAVARRLIDRASTRAAAIGAAGILPGAQLPVLIANQVRLVSQLASLHGRPEGRERTAEIAGLVAAGYGWRKLARSAARRLPGSRLIVRSGIAYGATRATGEAALRRYARGESPPGSQ